MLGYSAKPADGDELVDDDDNEDFYGDESSPSEADGFGKAATVGEWSLLADSADRAVRHVGSSSIKHSPVIHDDRPISLTVHTITSICFICTPTDVGAEAKDRESITRAGIASYLACQTTEHASQIPSTGHPSHESQQAESRWSFCTATGREEKVRATARGGDNAQSVN